MSVKDLLNKSEWSEFDIINFILEASASSARFGIVKEKENNGYYITRANLHAMLVMPFGTGKTSSFIGIKDAVYANDISFPGLIGTINKDGEVVESAIMKAGGKILVIDEFQLLSKEVKNALNSILEYPHVYSRTLGYKIRSSVNKRGKYFYIKAKQNTNKFEVYSKFSCIASGMFFNRKTTIDKALTSRFVLISFNPPFEWYKSLSRGERAIKINPELREIDFIFEDYLRFNDLFWKKIEESAYYSYFRDIENERGYLVRYLQDIVRFGCFLASLENRNEVKTEDCIFVLERITDFCLSSYILHTLDEISFFVLRNLGRYNQKEIAEQLNVSEARVSQVVKQLKSKGLLKEI